MWTVILRTIIIFFALLLLMRLLGKRQMGELELSELVVSILVADVASVPLQSPELPLWSGLLPAFVLFSLEYLLAWATMKSVTLRAFLCGRPCFLVVNGVVQQAAMRKNRFTLDELAEELRAHDVGDLSDVRYAVLETDGTLNVLLRPERQVPTAGQLGVAAPDDGYGVILVQEGRVLRRNLAQCGRDEAWLMDALRARGCASLREAYALILFESGKIYFEKMQ
ncbi:MAG: DUF421 domain-containing protein [Oscillospiraceae bacterium]|nr:DUF421 domain-containing protein [Oscillospiraceae bacterium]